MTRVVIALGVLSALFGSCLQSHWDAECQQHGFSRWDADPWECI